MPLPQPTAYPQITGTAQDNDQQYFTPGCNRLLVQISNQAVYITFQYGNPPIDYGPAEFFMPVVGPIVRRFDGFKVRAAIKAANLPAGATQAFIALTPCR